MPYELIRDRRRWVQTTITEDSLPRHRLLRLLPYVLFVNVLTAGSVLSSADDGHVLGNRV